jgi:uncharacterized membrane protein (UPF0127 family)
MSVTKEDGYVVAEEVERADTLLKQIVGLMFRKSVPGSYAMVFSMKRDNRDGLHMLFMHFPIDVAFLDSEKRILSIHRNLKPWTGMAFSSKPFRYVIELPAGAADRASLKEGDRLSW